MSFLHKIWDETLAGPTPESGLGKLRKYNSFAATRSGNIVDDDAPPPPPHPQSLLLDKDDISHGSIMIPINNYHRNLRVSVDSSSLPSSPSGSITPTSPFTPSTPTSSNLKKLTRRKSQQNSKPKPPNGYDWIVLSALDR